MIYNTHKKQQRGMTLIEASLTILVLGLMLAAIITLFNQAQRQAQPQETRDKMQAIVKALSTYVETTGRLPCPADPSANNAAFGWEWNVTIDKLYANQTSRPMGWCGDNTNPTNDGIASVTGIIPFQSLNLPAEMARDGWGNYFTYAVSPEFTLDNDANPPNPNFVPKDDDDFVHARCRTKAWVDLLDNISAVKARFCCATSPKEGGYFPPTTDVRVQLYNVAAPAGNVTPVRVASGGTGYGEITELYTAAPNNVRATEPPRTTTENIEAPAFVLVSHGIDGRGAFGANGNLNRINVDAAYTREAENWDGDRLYFTGESSFANTAGTYFDDIVLWMTQDGIMAANGTSSCHYP